jgi:hypothetical protein
MNTTCLKGATIIAGWLCQQWNAGMASGGKLTKAKDLSAWKVAEAATWKGDLSIKDSE